MLTWEAISRPHDFLPTCNFAPLLGTGSRPAVSSSPCLKCPLVTSCVSQNTRNKPGVGGIPKLQPLSRTRKILLRGLLVVLFREFPRNLLLSYFLGVGLLVSWLLV